MCETVRQKFPWITDDLLKRIVHQPTNLVRIHSVDIRNALEVGENFASDMMRMRIEFDADKVARSTKSVIIKAMKSDQSMSKEMGLFRREIAAYALVLPRVEAVLRSIGDKTRFAAKYANCMAQCALHGGLYLVLHYSIVASEPPVTVTTNKVIRS